MLYLGADVMTRPNKKFSFRKFVLKEHPDVIMSSMNDNWLTPIECHCSKPFKNENNIKNYIHVKLKNRKQLWD